MEQETTGRSKKRIIFIINPISGAGKQTKTGDLILSHLDLSRYEPQVIYTQFQGHATDISRQEAAGGARVIVAVGGDGTVNEVASGLVNTDATMAIIPAGSGNGLARHLKIPMNLVRAIELINKGKETAIDTATLNDQVFVNVAGVGFDAAIARKFSEAGTRGFSTYLRITAGSYRDYNPQKYRLTIDGKVYKRRALLISFANSSQFGNNAVIDSTADVRDGLIDVCIVGKVPFYKAIFLAPLLFLKRFDRTRYIEIIRAKEVYLHRKKGKTIHLDGDPKKMGKDLVMKINPLSLKVIIP